MTRVGSVQWAAPEVLLGQSYSHKCDLWSYGVVCWELLTAQIPFEKMSQHVVATRVAMEGMRLPVPSRAPPMLLRLIARCWSDAPAQRPEFQQVVLEIEEMLAAMIAATPNPSDEQLPPTPSPPIPVTILPPPHPTPPLSAAHGTPPRERTSGKCKHVEPPSELQHGTPPSRLGTSPHVGSPPSHGPPPTPNSTPAR